VTDLSLEELALAYAHALDSNRPELLEQIFTPKAELTGPTRKYMGRAAIMAVPNMLASKYRCTTHLVGNRLILSAGAGHARGETYCLAHHLSSRPEGLWVDEIMAIRYRDEYEKTGDEWRFSSRRLQVDWLETREALSPDPAEFSRPPIGS